MYRDEIKREADKLGIKLYDLALCVVLVSGECYPLCFLENETNDLISFQVTQTNGREHFYTFNKSSIDYIHIQYDINLEMEERNDKTSIYE